MIAINYNNFNSSFQKEKKKKKRKKGDFKYFQ